MEYCLLAFVGVTFLMACRCQFDSKYGAEWTKLTIIPKDSFWRKIYPFKEKESNPLRYVMLIPFYITFVILVSVLIVYIIFWISPSLLSNFLQSIAVGFVSVAYMMVVFIYYLIMEIDFKF